MSLAIVILADESVTRVTSTTKFCETVWILERPLKFNAVAKPHRTTVG